MTGHFPGIPDEQFIRGEMPMTKQEVRILTLARARISPTDTVIDIGAGTGSISVEAGLLAHQGIVYAIEREAEGIELIRANAAKFGADNIRPICGNAPDALSGLPAANAILIGGSGGRLKDIIECGDKLLKPGGRMVVNAVTVETLEQALSALRGIADYVTEAFGVQVNRIKHMGRSSMFQALNPVYIITGSKGGANEGYIFIVKQGGF